jgi:Leucine Rich repeats (2 copies)
VALYVSLNAPAFAGRTVKQHFLHNEHWKYKAGEIYYEFEVEIELIKWLQAEALSVVACVYQSWLFWFRLRSYIAGYNHNRRPPMLNKNNLAILLPEFGELVELRELWLHDNQLSALPDTFRQLTQLRTLVLNGNQLAELPAGIGQFRKLKLPMSFGCFGQWKRLLNPVVRPNSTFSE